MGKWPNAVPLLQLIIRCITRKRVTAEVKDPLSLQWWVQAMTASSTQWESNGSLPY